MTEKKTMLTYDGLKKLEEELQDLKVVRRREVAEKIKEARSQGDLSENAEYDAAKDEQAALEARIMQLEKMLRNAEVIDDEGGHDTVGLGTRVMLKDIEANEEVTYMIVGSTEADPFKGRISNESPLGKALMGHAAGDHVTVEAPDGFLEYEILSIA